MSQHLTIENKGQKPTKRPETHKKTRNWSTNAI